MGLFHSFMLQDTFGQADHPISVPAAPPAAPPAPPQRDLQPAEDCLVLGYVGMPGKIYEWIPLALFQPSVLLEQKTCGKADTLRSP